MKAIIVPNLSILCQAIDLESSVSVRSSELSSRASYSTTVLYQPDIFINKRAESRVLSKTLSFFEHQNFQNSSEGIVGTFYDAEFSRINAFSKI